jgi:actin-related protein
MRHPAVVLDVGTGYTKLGFAGNVEVRPWAIELVCSERISYELNSLLLTKPDGNIARKFCAAA